VEEIPPTSNSLEKKKEKPRPDRGGEPISIRAWQRVRNPYGNIKDRKRQMIDNLKKMAAEKGMAVMKSPVVAKIMASETAGVVIEKAMTVPFKISNIMTQQKEKLVEMFDLATQEEMDDLRRTISRLEAELSAMKSASEKPAD
jgi:uncharacterized protein (UPF0216 family)